jgi:hypothetical protein
VPLDDVNAVEVGAVDPETLRGRGVKRDVLNAADPELLAELRNQAFLVGFLLTRKPLTC